MGAGRSIFTWVSPGQDSHFKFPSGEEETTPLSLTPSRQGRTSRTHFHSLQTRATPSQHRVLPMASHRAGSSAAGRLLDSYWQGLPTPGWGGGGEEGRKANFVSQGETIADSCP